MEEHPDERLRKELMDSIDDPMLFVNRLHAYYYDADRADRTPRAVLYLHLGMLCGLVMKQRQPSV
jgi:hypothetical protein